MEILGSPKSLLGLFHNVEYMFKCYTYLKTDSPAKKENLNDLLPKMLLNMLIKVLNNFLKPLI